MKKTEILKWFILAIAVAINLFILINAFINGEVSAKESNTVAHTAADVVNTVKPETITPQNFNDFAFSIRKIVGHFLLFTVSGVFTSWAIYLFLVNKRIGYFLWQLCISLGFGLFLALFTEFAQIFVEGRTGAWLDVGIDYSGYFLGIFLVFLIFFIRKSPIFFRQNYSKKQVN